MDLTELIGLIITVVAFIVLSARKAKEHSSGSSEGSASGQEEKLKKFLNSLDLEMKEERSAAKKAVKEQKNVKVKPKPLKKPRGDLGPYNTSMEEHRLESNLEDHRFKSRLELHQLSSNSIVSEAYRIKSTHAYDIVQKGRRKSRAKGVLEQVKGKKDWMIIAEILKKPKAYE